jgi:HKD family nuclease
MNQCLETADRQDPFLRRLPGAISRAYEMELTVAFITSSGSAVLFDISAHREIAGNARRDDR